MTSGEKSTCHYFTPKSLNGMCLFISSGLSIMVCRVEKMKKKRIKNQEISLKTKAGSNTK